MDVVDVILLKGYEFIFVPFFIFKRVNGFVSLMSTCLYLLYWRVCLL